MKRRWKTHCTSFFHSSSVWSLLVAGDLECISISAGAFFQFFKSELNYLWPSDKGGQPEVGFTEESGNLLWSTSPKLAQIFRSHQNCSFPWWSSEVIPWSPSIPHDKLLSKGKCHHLWAYFRAGAINGTSYIHSSNPLFITCWLR
jgi:hypothetical protein